MQLLQEHFPELSLGALRSGDGRNDLRIPEFKSWPEVDRQNWDIAFIATPTYLHTKYALEGAKRKMHLFIEKPIDSSWKGLEELIELIQRNHLTSYVAYPFRFHPVMSELKKMLEGKKVLHAQITCASYMPSWRSKQNHRDSYSSYKAQGGGVILDLSHEIDYAEFLFGEVKTVQGIYGRKSSITVDSEDCADLILQHETTVTNVHLNYFSRFTRRTIEVDLENQFIEADLKNNFIRKVSEAGEEEIQRFSVRPDDMFITQLHYFFSNLENPNMENHLAKASKLFRKLLDFKENHENSLNAVCEKRLQGSLR